MSDKSYLKNQIKLVSLNANDTFTNDEYDKYMEIISLVNEIDRLDASDNQEDIIKKKELIAIKKKASSELTEMIKQHKGIPRKVRLESVIFHREGEELPDGVTWRNLKLSKKIAEFESDMSRAMGLQTNDYTFDKIIVKWKNLDLLEQLVLDGFTMDILVDGKIVQKKYRCFTASAGQLRRDKFQAISEDMWIKIKDRVECGLDWETLNARGSTNVNKFLAYIALIGSATDPWDSFDIERCIVVPDWEGDVTDRMMYIKPDYTTEVGVRTVKINHVDGAGMILPDADIIPEHLRKKNFMFRGPYFKGLLSSFDFIKFCKVNNLEPVVTDIYNVKHNLIEENIQILFTASQFKLYKLYRSWQEYKDAFKRCGCKFGITQFEEDELPDKQFNYQMAQTLTDMSDEEILEFTSVMHKKILNLAQDQKAMLKTLKAREDSPMSDKVALAIYPELLRDAYSRQQIKDAKKRMMQDAKSGAITCRNKRLFALPDWYAYCEHLFGGEEHPKGLLENGYIACKPYRKFIKADVLRSPHLFMEHAIRKIAQDSNVYEWFYTDGVYTSCHDLITRILQLDQWSSINTVNPEIWGVRKG